MNQTDIAVTGGIICSLAGGIIFRSVTGWNSWVATATGAIISFFVVTIGLYCLVGILGSIITNKDSTDGSNE